MDHVNRYRYCPIVHASEFELVASHLLRAFQENESSDGHLSSADELYSIEATRPHSVSTRRKHQQKAHKRTPTFPVMAKRSKSHDLLMNSAQQTSPSPSKQATKAHRRHQTSVNPLNNNASFHSPQTHHHYWTTTTQDSGHHEHGKSSPLLVPSPSLNQPTISGPFADDALSPLHILLSDEDEYASSNDEDDGPSISNRRRIRASLGIPAANISLYGALNWEELPRKGSRKSVGDSPSNRRMFARQPA